MGYLRFAREAQQHYMIVGYNDEELYVLGELLMNENASTTLKDLIDNEEQHEAESGNFKFKKIKDDDIRISFFKHDKEIMPNKPFEIDLKCNQLEDLIDVWDDYMLASPPVLILNREHDSDIVTLTHEESVTVHS